MTVEKPKPKQSLQPITTETNSSMNQSQFLAITCNSPEAREISRVHGAMTGAIGFDFASHWLKNWRKSFKPITMRSNRNHVITFDSHLKTALMRRLHCSCRLSFLNSLFSFLQPKPFNRLTPFVPKGQRDVKLLSLSCPFDLSSHHFVKEIHMLIVSPEGKREMASRKILTDQNHEA